MHRDKPKWKNAIESVTIFIKNQFLCRLFHSVLYRDICMVHHHHGEAHIAAKQKLIMHQIATSISTFDCINSSDSRINGWIYERSLFFFYYCHRMGEMPNADFYRWSLWNAKTIFIWYFITIDGYVRLEFIRFKQSRKTKYSHPVRQTVAHQWQFAWN